MAVISGCMSLRILSPFWHFVLTPVLFCVFSGCTRTADTPSARIDPVAQPAVAEPDVPETRVVPSKSSDADFELVPVAPDSRAKSAASDSASHRAPIYDVETSGEALIAAALKRAKRDQKRVLVEFGGNWCGWCYKLHDVFLKNDIVRPIVFEEYELVLVDEGRNRDLMLAYGGHERAYSFPHLTILEADGTVLTNQETGSLERGPKHDPQLVAEFLNQWVSAKQDAEQLLADALTTAASGNRRVLVRVGTPDCGWCKVLAQFVQDHEQLFATDYVDLKIDTMRMNNGEQVAARLHPNGSGGGVPWMVILAPSGEVLTSSFGPAGNIGYPYLPEEIAYFISMLRDTRHNLTDDNLSLIEADLNRYRTEREQKAAHN